jgi:hypothetical protein
MSKLNSIKEKKFKQPKIWLEEVSFDFEDEGLGPHIHYVTNAASMRDDPLLLKSKEELTDTEKEILKKINKKPTKKETKMNEVITEDLKKEMETKNEELQKRLDDALKLLKEQQKVAAEAEAEKKLMKVQKSIEDFEVDAEVADILVKLDDADQTIITKAFADLKAFEIEKEVPKEENELQKKLSKEEGAEGEGGVVEKSINERISAYRK